MDKITFCLLLTNQNNTLLLSKILLNLGIVSYIASDNDSALDILNKKSINFLFVDLDFSNNLSFELLKKLKENDKFSSLFIIVTSFNVKEIFLKKLQEYNIVSFIAKPFYKEQIEEKINSIINKVKGHYLRREHIRIIPENDEFMRASFKLKNNKSISGKLVNLSMGGFALMLYINYNDEELGRGKLIEHINFIADNREIDVDAKIINKKDKLIAFQFTHFYNDSYKNLSKYIIKKISV